MRAARHPLWLVAVAAFAAGCTTATKPVQTQLEVREYQTRTFDSDVPIELKAGIIWFADVSM